ncbi:hypothetical protein CMI37_34745 [Candidatus Pacearchaeota archaeon]|nr:hypothetical protein [Candidatus Pacearchaeota archaeon]
MHKKFTGYFSGWNRCECGATLLLNKKQGLLKHRTGGEKRHEIVMRRREFEATKNLLRKAW